MRTGKAAPKEGEIAVPAKIERPSSPFVITKMRHKSFLSEKVQAAIRGVIEKVNNAEKEQQLAAQEQIVALEEKVNRLGGDIFSY